MMTIYESMTFAVANELGRYQFLGNSYHMQPHGFQSRFFRWLLIAYGDGFYELPKRMNLPPRGNGSWLFPAFTLPQTMRCGIAPSEAITYASMGAYEHQYTPLHIGTALSLYGHDFNAKEIDRLLSTSFLKRAYPSKSPDAFASHAFINPFSPEDIGRRPFDYELLEKAPGELAVVDELGNAAWFPPEYLQSVLKRVGSAHWYSMLCKLSMVHGKWQDLVQHAAAELLRDRNNTGLRVKYGSTTNYLRNVKSGVARDYLKRVSGVREALNVVRRDATPQEMATGLRTLVSNQNARTEEVFRYIGRDLVIEDFRLLTPRQALLALYYAPYDAVKQVIATNSQELGSMFFSLTDAKTLPLITNCMSPHGSREKPWIPDTDVGNLSHLVSISTTTPESIREEWEKSMRDLVDAYDRAKVWRDELIQHAPPEVLFLSLLRWAGREENDPIAEAAIENVLRSYPTITEVQNVIGAMPEAIAKLKTL